MSNTNWDSPHGMGNRQNLTSVADMFKLCEKALRMPLLRKVMTTKVYSCKPMRDDGQGNLVPGSRYVWINTNRLLGVDGITGLKPGWTPQAGHCLAVSYHKEGHNFVVVTVQGKSKMHFWTEIQELIDWAIWRKKQLSVVPAAKAQRPVQT